MYFLIALLSYRLIFLIALLQQIHFILLGVCITNKSNTILLLQTDRQIPIFTSIAGRYE